MTPREQLFAALNGEVLDRPPVWLLFPYHATDYYVDVRHHPRYRSIHAQSLGKAIILNRRNFSAPIFVADPSLPKRLESDEDLEFAAFCEVEVDPNRIVAALDRQLPQYQREKAEFPEHLGAMMLDLGEPIGWLYHHANLEQFAVWSLTHDAVVQDLLERFMQRYREIYRYCLERELADVYFMVGSELAAPPMVSRDTFRRWIVPYAKELIGLVHSYGKKVIQHFHGQVRDLLPDFVEMGADALHTIEAPPVGNCTFTEAFASVGNRLTLIGNIQYDEFRARSPEQMGEAVRDVVRECEGKRFILSPTAGPFDPNPSERLIANYHAFLSAAQTIGKRSK